MPTSNSPNNNPITNKLHNSTNHSDDIDTSDSFHFQHDQRDDLYNNNHSFEKARRMDTEFIDQQLIYTYRREDFINDKNHKENNSNKKRLTSKLISGNCFDNLSFDKVFSSCSNFQDQNQFNKLQDINESDNRQNFEYFDKLKDQEDSLENQTQEASEILAGNQDMQGDNEGIQKSFDLRNKNEFVTRQIYKQNILQQIMEDDEDYEDTKMQVDKDIEPILQRPQKSQAFMSYLLQQTQLRNAIQQSNQQNNQLKSRIMELEQLFSTLTIKIQLNKKNGQMSQQDREMKGKMENDMKFMRKYSL